MRRMTDLFAPYDVKSIDIKEASKISRSLRMHDAHRLFKTWVNSWSTSYRFDETPKLQCLFGCQDQKDELKHYLVCPILFALQVQMFDSSPP